MEQFGDRLQSADEWNYELNLYIDYLEERLDKLENELTKIDKKINTASIAGVSFGTLGGMGIGIASWGIGELITGNSDGLGKIAIGTGTSLVSYGVWALGKYLFKWW